MYGAAGLLPVSVYGPQTVPLCGPRRWSYAMCYLLYDLYSVIASMACQARPHSALETSEPDTKFAPQIQKLVM